MKTKIILLLCLIFLSCFSCEKQLENIIVEPRKVRGIPAVTKQQPDEASGFGSLSFLTKIDITAPQEAVIKKLYFREGDIVEQGQILIQLENPQIILAVERAENNYQQALAARNLSEARLLEGIFQAEAQLLSLEKADAELNLAKRKWEEDTRKHQHQEKLYKIGGINTEAILGSRFTIDTEWEQLRLMEKELEIRKIGSRDKDLITAGISIPADAAERQNAFISLMTSSLNAELEAAHARLEAAEKELTSAKIARAELRLRCPSSGIIGARYLEEGERVRPQDKIISLIDTASLYAIFPVREKDALRIEKGMSASVFVDGTGETRDGAVDLIYPQADSQSLSFLVRVLLLNAGVSDIRLKPGMFSRITVNLGPPKNAVYIPESAIFNRKNNEGSVFVINGSALTERKISTGPSQGDECEITAGLNEGELIVLRPGPELREGVHVSVAE